jgi:hypothetical protein
MSFEGADFHYLMETRTGSVNLTFPGNVEVFSLAPAAPKIRQPKKGRPLQKSDKHPNPYFLFCQQRRTELHAEYPDMPSREITRMLADEWNNLANDVKATFQHKYQQSLEGARNDHAGVTENGRRKIWIQLQTQDGQSVSIPAFCEI